MGGLVPSGGAPQRRSPTGGEQEGVAPKAGAAPSRGGGLSSRLSAWASAWPGSSCGRPGLPSGVC